MSKTGSENKKKNTVQPDINTDIYERVKTIRKKQNQKYEKNKRLVDSMSTSIRHLPSSIYANSAINANVNIDVPLYIYTVEML